MKISGIQIERLQLKLPGTALQLTPALAKSAATVLARSLRQEKLSVSATPRIQGLDVRVAREHANATGIAKAIRASIMRSVDPVRNRK